MGIQGVHHINLLKNDHSMRKVSILVPVYNVEQYIERCVVSLFEQTYENIEYIFVNDYTPDGSISIIKNILPKYPKRIHQVKIINHVTNKGIAAARNTAVYNSSGDYLMYVDSDDYVDVHAVERLVNKIEIENADIVICDYFVINSDIRLIKNSIPKGKEDYIRLLMTKQVAPSLWGKLYNATFYKNTHIQFCEAQNYGEDYAVIPRLVYYAKKVVRLRCPLYYYVQYNLGSYTKNITENSVNQMVWADKILEEFFSSVPDKEKYTQALILSKLRTKVNLLKRGNKALFKMINSLYPELTVHYRFMLSYKDRILLTLVENHLYTLALIYIRFGFFISRLK